eukprot:m.11805 g.11805  ORF g.11805 m.11805 type:complete len:74 (-) comp5940_c0_seq1:67-288(-)
MDSVGSVIEEKQVEDSSCFSVESNEDSVRHASVVDHSGRGNDSFTEMFTPITLDLDAAVDNARPASSEAHSEI